MKGILAPMLTKILSKMFGTKHERDIKKLAPTVEKINSLEPEMQKLSDEALKAKTAEFQERLNSGESLNDILPEAFAVCREGAVRVLGMRHYDVQMIGGLVLNRGGIAEMKTGEGKTLVATLPMYLHGLTKKGAHCVTVNDYLASRDAEWMGRLYNFLGLSVGVIVHGLSDTERKDAYGADITYGTNNEFGFDYLRDNMKFDIEDYVQRPPNFAIVDECDSILIDEARTPLIISGPAEESVEKYYEINKIIPELVKDVHFTMEEKSKTVSLTEEGNSKVEELLGVQNIYDATNIGLVHHVYQGLKAHHLFIKDVDYMVKDGEVVIVDEFTGRLMPGRRWSDGLHQAVDAKEGVEIKGENQTLATVTFQNYFRMYPTLAGMTGTAETEEVEFKKIYNLDVVVVPTNKPIARMDQEDVVYKTEKGKYTAMVEDIAERHKTGQPVLVGTVSIEKSEEISRHLRAGGITHNVLNAKHHEREADIVSQAGRLNAITIATNMAGRGTDIKLGGNAEALAAKEAGEDETTDQYQAALKKYEEQCAAEKEKVLSAGGLYIMGTERNESRRIDNQLRGRSGRQGDPGESRFFLSLEDSLMRIFNGERIQKIMNTLNVPDDEPIVAGMVTRAIEGAQRKVEGHNFDIRKHLLDYDDVMNKQRNSIYGIRKQVLAGEGIDRLVLDMLGGVTSRILDRYIPEGTKANQWDLDGLDIACTKQFGLKLDFGDRSQLTIDGLTEMVSSGVKHVYDHQKTSLGEHFEEVQKMVLLETIDTRWKEHLSEIDQLKEGINLRAYAQKDPLVEYKKEAFATFQRMMGSMEAECIEKLLKIQLMNPEDIARMEAERAAFEDGDFDYYGNESETAQAAFSSAPQSNNVGSPMMNPNQNSMQDLQYSGGGAEGQEAGPKLNRAERRRREREAKKRRR